MISPRYVVPLCVLVAFALIPTFIHSYAATTVVDGRTTALIPSELAGFSSRPSARNAVWGKRRFDSDDWIERRYLSGADEVVLTVVRSRDFKSLYHHPELAVAYGTSFAHHEIRRLAGRSDAPIHVLRPDVGSRAIAVYALLYDEQFVEHPIRFQIQLASKLLLSRPKSMTLFFAQDPDMPPAMDLEALPAVTVLLAAIDRFGARPSEDPR